jgi:hypothetical protein
MTGFGSSAAVNLPGHGNGPNLKGNVLWRAILHAEFDFTWPPWDSIPGERGGSGLSSVCVCGGGDVTAYQLQGWQLACAFVCVCVGGGGSGGKAGRGAILHAELDFTWPPWDSTPGER